MQTQTEKGHSYLMNTLFVLRYYWWRFINYQFPFTYVLLSTQGLIVTPAQDFNKVSYDCKVQTLDRFLK